MVNRQEKGKKSRGGKVRKTRYMKRKGRAGERWEDMAGESLKCNAGEI